MTTPTASRSHHLDPGTPGRRFTTRAHTWRSCHVSVARLPVRMRRRATVMGTGRSVTSYALASALLVALAACGADPDELDPASSGRKSGTGEVAVLAAASLTTPLTSLANAYEKANPETTIQLSFASSTTLAQQISQGAEVDLFLSAGAGSLEEVDDAEPTATTTIARNTLGIVTPPDNPADIDSLADLAKQDVAVVLCAEAAPCGKVADEVLAKAGVTANVVSREVDVSATLAKVTLGEADAAIVYRSDVVSAAGTVRGVEIPAAQNTVVPYPLVRFGSDDDAAAFAAYVAGPEGLRVLQKAGFLAP
ncbi:MAG: molybdate ABC transporter substrate-binding protein [Dermatophilaceae bacterium]